MPGATVPPDLPPADKGREDDLVFPPHDLDQLLDLAVFIQNRAEPGQLMGRDGEQIPLPREVYRVIQRAVEVMSQGKATLVAPQSLLLTTQEAAEFLGVSRPTLVKLLEDGAIPFDQPNRHRRVGLQDVLDYRARRHAAQRAALDQLTEETSALGLHESSDAEHIAAIASARSRARKEGMTQRPTSAVSSD